MTRRWLVCFVILMGCGESEAARDVVLMCESNPIEAFETCGGDLQGLWHVTSACLPTGTSISAETPCGAGDLQVEIGMAGALEFDGEQSLSSLSVRTRFSTRFAASCLPEGTSCGELVPSEPLTICADRGSECLCSGTQVEQFVRDSTLTTQEDGIITVTNTEETAELRYCINEDDVMEIVAPTAPGIDSSIIMRLIR